jgi:hypothetical protein
MGKLVHALVEKTMIELMLLCVMVLFLYMLNN